MTHLFHKLENHECNLETFFGHTCVDNSVNIVFTRPQQKTFPVTFNVTICCKSYYHIKTILLSSYRNNVHCTKELFFEHCRQI